MGQAVVHFEVIGTDGPRLRSYYGDLFGWKFNDVGAPMDYQLVDPESARNAQGVGIGGGIGGFEGPGHVTFYVEVPDVEAALARAESLGGKRLRGPDPVPGTEIVLGHFEDPEGHVIGVTSPQP